MNVTCIIPARMSSSRFPGKPLALIDGVEMLKHVIHIAEGSLCINEIIVATEDVVIKEFVERECPDIRVEMTGSYVTCTHRMSEVARRLMTAPDVIVGLQGDEPCITPQMIESMVYTHVHKEAKMLQATYALDNESLNDEDCVKAIVNNDEIIYLARRPEIITSNLTGIAGLYTWDYATITQFPMYDLRLVNAWRGLDTFGFIGRVPVTPFQLEYRTHAVDRPSDIPIVANELHRRHKKSKDYRPNW